MGHLVFLYTPTVSCTVPFPGTGCYTAALAVGCSGGGGTAGTGRGALGHVSGLGSGEAQGSTTDGLRARATRARQLVRKQSTARAWRGLKLKAEDRL